jgi:type IV fimbrial biogenesis protein FimT
MAAMSMKNPQRGVTLIELAVVMVITAILLAQASPLFAAWTQNVQIRTATESIQNGLQLARSEAIRRNRSVMFWLTSSGNAPANPQTANWLVGCMNPIGAGVQPEAAGDCPGTQTSATPTAYNWIQMQTAAAQGTTNPQVTAVDANGNAANNVTFNSLGLVTGNSDGSTSIVQIDVANPSVRADLVRPLRVTVSGGGIRMCDPFLSLANDPRGCQ